jgi:hypothetical protein
MATIDLSPPRLGAVLSKLSHVSIAAVAHSHLVWSQLWRVKGFFDGPAALQSCPNRSQRNIGFDRPFGDRLDLTSVLKLSIVRSIRHLNLLRRPSHIAFFVMTVVINSVERHAIRAWAKASKELLEAREVALDTSAAVVGVTLVLWVATARTHVQPAHVLASGTVLGLHPVLPQSHSKRL